ncbi:MAG TPA: ATP-binding protein [Candidatus Nitrosotenuis sp.]|nr:ATP-binding protein [Candidatus Nitrosotenuis sp.]
MKPAVECLEAEIERLRRRCQRERKARLEAEAIAEKAIRELYDLNRELQRSNQELQQFAYVASHDLQEPLRIILAFGQRLAERCRGQLDEKAQTSLGYILDAAAQMRALVEGLLTYARVGRGGRPRQEVDCTRALLRALANLRASIEETGAEVTWGELPTLPADETELTLVFQNLVGNALKFRREEPPRVRVEARRAGGSWILSVSDNGIGIEPRHLEQLFQPFRRLHTRREYPGTGIGLALCRKIAEGHGGSISVESIPGQGSVFRLTLPAQGGGHAVSPDR